MTDVIIGFCLPQQTLMAFYGGSAFDTDPPFSWVNTARPLPHSVKRYSKHVYSAANFQSYWRPPTGVIEVRKAHFLFLGPPWSGMQSL